MNTSQTNEDPKRTKNERNHSSNPRTQEPIFNTFFHLLGFFEVRIYTSHLEGNRKPLLVIYDIQVLYIQYYTGSMEPHLVYPKYFRSVTVLL